jgi:hypothetical protein
MYIVTPPRYAKLSTTITILNAVSVEIANQKNSVINYRNIAVGLYVFSIGLFKKVVIADAFAVCANDGFDTATKLNFGNNDFDTNQFRVDISGLEFVFIRDGLLNV